MYKLLFLLIFILSSTIYGQELSPGSYTIKYGGPYKAATSEINKFLGDQWVGQEEEAYLGGEISFGNYARRQQHIVDFLNDWKHGAPWWTRSWLQSMVPDKGGAPLNHSIQIRYGYTYKIIDTPLFSFSNSFDFKWKSLEATVDFAANRPIIFSTSKPPETGLQFKFSPDISVSTSGLWQATNIIRTIGFSVSTVYVVKKIPIFSIIVTVQYRPRRRATTYEVQLRMLQW